MAQLVTPSNNIDPRISQLLPSVKCSNCGQTVPLSSLGDHVCHKLSPSKAILAKIRSPSVITPPPPQQPQQRGPPIPSPQQRRPSNASSHSQFHSTTIPPRATPSPSPTLLIPPINNHIHHHQQSPSTTSQFSNYPRRPSDASLSNLPPPPPIQHQFRAHTPEPDTKSGGEAGMAGVGRRGFQAAVQAAMFATYTQNAVHLHTPSIASGFDGRRPNPPGYLNINPNLANSRDRGPLSASSLTPSSLSQSPLPSPRTPRTPSPATILYTTPIATTSPTSIKQPSYSDKFNHNLSVQTVPLASKNNLSLLSPPTSELSDGSGSGLAYDDDVSPPPISPPTLRHSKSLASTSNSRRPSNADKNTYQFPALDEKPLTSRPPPSRSASSSSSYSNPSSRSTVKSTGGFTRALETLFENRISSPPSSPTTTNQTIPPVPRTPALSASAATSTTTTNTTDRTTGKLPMRSRTTPAMSSTHARHSTNTDADDSKEKSRKHKARDCTRCDKKILDGRWIQADGAGVLCERCWKNMYLPKCRRCGLPIEKQAVSSSDGQLKGKYHRECFNCHTCHEPFPDKEFYVFDGQPFCRYHYHEVNNSLCMSSSCGQPIEGPCAVSHAGARYHPEHLICEYDGGDYNDDEGEEGKCGQRLDEYWEIDRRMLCERHARVVEEREGGARNELRGRGGDVAGLNVNFSLKSGRGAGNSAAHDAIGGGGLLVPDASTAREARAQKRVTKFIDLR